MIASATSLLNDAHHLIFPWNCRGTATGLHGSAMAFIATALPNGTTACHGTAMTAHDGMAKPSWHTTREHRHGLTVRVSVRVRSAIQHGNGAMAITWQCHENLMALPWDIFYVASNKPGQALRELRGDGEVQRWRLIAWSRGCCNGLQLCGRTSCDD